MSWMVTAIAGSAALGAVSQNANAQQQQRQKKAEMMANAAQIQYSPWTGAKAQVMGNDAADPNAAAVNGALQGGLTGGLMASQFGKGKPTPTPETPTPSVTQQLQTQPMGAGGGGPGGPMNSAGGMNSTWGNMQPKPTMYGDQAVNYGNPYSKA